MKRIAWLSRHAPLPIQRDALANIYGQVDIVQITDTWRGADDLIAAVRDYDDVVIVAPLSLIAEVVRRGLRPIRACMELMPSGTDYDGYRDVIEHGRHYRFAKFERIIAIDVRTEPLAPADTAWMA